MQKTLPLYILGGLVTVCFFAMCAFLIFFTVPKEQANMVWAFFGVLGAAFTSVVQYFFGSSSGSAAKTEMLNQPQSVVVDPVKAPAQPV
jgi:uncharacterized BrkB/YihY/UPF0761 family membrane protein